jgi:hypothetical protein
MFTESKFMAKTSFKFCSKRLSPIFGVNGSNLSLQNLNDVLDLNFDSLNVICCPF